MIYRLRLFAFLILLLCISTVVNAQTSAQNYIATWSAMAPEASATNLLTRPGKDVQLGVQYFDGLGRPMQTVIRQGSLITGATAGDLVTPIEYDSYGRQSKNYLPYAASATDAGFKSSATSAQSTFYASGNPSSPVAGQGENLFYSQTNFELSPLDRPIKTLAPGNSWLGAAKGVATGYYANTTADGVRIWNVTIGSSSGSILSSYASLSTYGVGQLYKTITTDEADKQVIEFKDKDGLVVLKKVQLTGSADDGSGQGHDGWLCTYYMYDDLGNLRCVIQPEGVKTLSSSGWVLSQTTNAKVLSEQCFRYEYDGRNRMTIKKVPGAGPVYTVYDARDLPVMVQDSTLRALGTWNVTKYDNLNRPYKTYQTSNSTAFATLLSAAYNVSPYIPSGDSSNILTVTHYDDYNGLPAGLSSSMLTTWNTYFSATSTSWPYPVMPAKNSTITTKGLVTWSQVKLLGSSTYLSSANIYDDKGRVVQIQSQNVTGGIDVSTTQYSWNGKPLITVNKTQKVGTKPDTTVIVNRYTYDELWRTIKEETKIAYSKVRKDTASDWLVLSQSSYDAIGQLKRKLVGLKRNGNTNTYLSTPIDTLDYDYNIRGWLLGVNRAYTKEGVTTDNTTPPLGEGYAEPSGTLYDPASRLWGFDLAYDKIASALINGQSYNTTAQLTGNIAGMAWKTNSHGRVRKYDFNYDASNRLTGATFGQYTGSAFSNTTVNYNVSGLTYDNNGNITAMNQYGLKTSSNSSALVDQLTYTYQSGSNKLAKVADAVSNASENLGDFQNGTNTDDDYAYDGNGNLTKDQNKTISSITYNYLNLPQVVTVTGTGTVTYVYDASGNKWKKAVYNQATGKTDSTLYLGNNQYRNDTLQFFGTSEGRVRTKDSTGLILDYFFKDHLGNVRLVVTDQYGLQSPILEETHYYPFGLTMKGISSSQSNPMLTNKDKTFQGQKFDDELGLDWLEFKYRNHDPQIGRFIEIDPLADQYEYNSTYAFSENKVTGNVELEGLESVTVPTPEGPIPMVPIVQNPSASHSGPRPQTLGEALHDLIVNTASFLREAIITTATSTVANGYRLHALLSEGSNEKKDVDGVRPQTLVKSNGVSKQNKTNTETGSYTNTHKSGKTYSGKGSKSRSQKSAKRVERENNDPHIATDFTPANSERDAFKDEDTRIEQNGGHGNSSKNYNRRASPGKKYKKQDNTP
ncbi:DUF6443 domain-containing protein [Rhizosphaericola mali]|uniref:DUF6443 domain-containing protein n=1 Tax=Rhizosphaericola mali TaxID=2545455 RepID=A0A5P2G6C1_9BACT|nr:DUF6443 domain-containing protein [Rhizosphaericola mali]QES88763.1 hypothetical protein E0W69_008900 [Rhizosphaericola mali]